MVFPIRLPSNHQHLVSLQEADDFLRPLGNGQVKVNPGNGQGFRIREYSRCGAGREGVIAGLEAIKGFAIGFQPRKLALKLGKLGTIGAQR